MCTVTGLLNNHAVYMYSFEVDLFSVDDFIEVRYIAYHC